MKKLAVEQINWRDTSFKPIFDALDAAKVAHMVEIEAMPADISFCLYRLGYEFVEIKHFAQYRSVHLYYSGSDGTYTIAVHYMKLNVEVWFDPKELY